MREYALRRRREARAAADQWVRENPDADSTLLTKEEE